MGLILTAHRLPGNGRRGAVPELVAEAPGLACLRTWRSWTDRVADVTLKVQSALHPLGLGSDGVLQPKRRFHLTSDEP